MKISSERLDYFEEGIFAKIHRKVVKLKKEGKPVYDLSIGTPDFLPSKHITEALAKAASDPNNYKYTLSDHGFMLKAVSDYYKRRFGVTLDPENEIISVHGTQEGMGHLGMAICNKGDIVLLPNPGYPVFEAGAYFGEADIQYYPIIEENGFIPRLDKIPEDVLKKTKYIVTSYPSNPTGAVAPRSFYEELIRYAKKYGFLIINDNAYSDIVFTDESGFSFLSLEGAKEVGAEFFSLSKSFNVTGARISFLCGNKEIVSALNIMRSQLDFGMFLPVQYAAAAALDSDPEDVKKQCAEYRKRRDALCSGLRNIGWQVKDSKGTMFVFAKIPDKYTSSAEFCEKLIDACGVVCTPGISFGTLGEGYVRFALTKPAEELAKIAIIIGNSGVI